MQATGYIDREAVDEKGMTAMAANVYDVAKYILEQKAPMSAMKLQKLVYYAQAWSLVWDDAPLFPEPIEAWAGGPVVPGLWQEHRGRFELSNAETLEKGDSALLELEQKATIDIVLQSYGDRS